MLYLLERSFPSLDYTLFLLIINPKIIIYLAYSAFSYLLGRIKPIYLLSPLFRVDISYFIYFIVYLLKVLS